MQLQADVWTMKHIVKEIKTGPWKDTQQKALGLAVNTAVLAHSTADRVRRANQDLPKACLVEI